MKISEKIIMFLEKVRRLGFVHIVSSSVINKIISFASGIILVRILSKNEYGIYSYANNILGFFLLFTGFGTNAGMLQMCCETENKDQKFKVYSYGCYRGLLFNVILSIILILVGVVIPLPIEGANECLLIMSFLPVVQLYPQFQNTYLRAEQSNKKFAYSNTFQAFVTFLFACIFSFLWNVEGLIISQYVAGVLTVLFIAYQLKVPFPILKHNIINKVKKIFWRISGISMLNMGISQLMYLLDVFVLGIIVGNVDMIASYKVATIIPTALLFIPNDIAIFIYPMFVEQRENKEWLLKKYSLIVVGLGVFNFVISVGLFIFAPYLLSMIFGYEYVDATVPFRILCISYFFSGTFRIIAGNILVTQKKLMFNLIESILSSGLNTILNFFMITALNSIGAALATLLTMIFSSILSTIYLIYVIKKKENN